MEIDGILDLHTFRPSEVKDLLSDYIEECLSRDIRDIRIIHGKGLGVLRATVESVLKRHPAVLHYHLADETAGGRGATLVRLHPRPTC